MALYLSYFDTCGDFFFLYFLQLASERVWRENESARRLGSNVQGLLIFHIPPLQILFWRDDRMTLAEGLIDELFNLSFF